MATGGGDALRDKLNHDRMVTDDDDPSKTILLKIEGDSNGASDDGSDIEYEYEDITAEEAVKRGHDLATFCTPSELLVQTKVNLKIQKKTIDKSAPIKDDDGYTNPLNHEPLIIVPSSRVEDTLNERFNSIQNRNMKRNLDQFFTTVNYLRRRNKVGLDLIAAHKVNMMSSAERVTKTATKRLTVGEKIAAEQEASGPEDLVEYWKEHLDYWIQQFSWKRDDDSDPVSREQLDKDLEEYMANRSVLDMETEDDLNADIELFMKQKGYQKEDQQILDDDLDDYMSKRGQPMDHDDNDGDDELSSKTDYGSRFGKRTFRSHNVDMSEKDTGIEKENLDAELDSYKAQKGSSKFPTVNNPSASVSTSSFANYQSPSCMSGGNNGGQKLTPQQRVRQNWIKSKSVIDKKDVVKDDLDDDLELWRQRQLDKKRKESEIKEQQEREKEEALKKMSQQISPTKIAATHADDKFADEDFGIKDEDDELIWD